ncbi:MAG: protein-glutamate O-methyltransferase CheR [Phycisphaera sp.]|nr:MAG: protein-glutamate O-methyltransferase CheR [Phycisphaera sp.]
MNTSTSTNKLLTDKQFVRISSIAFDKWGLSLGEKKVQLVSTRVSKYLRTSRFSGVDAYLDYIEQEATPADLLELFDLLSTNVTSFFREIEHFNYLEREFYTSLARGNTTRPGKRIRIWSAACSTGPEPYSMAIQALECLPQLDKWDFKILGTDLANSAVEKARSGIYPAAMLENMPKELLAKYFEPQGSGEDLAYRVNDRVRSLVTIGQLNLMDEWPFRGRFDVVFCRNVMIYFDKPTKDRLVNRICDVLQPGGVLAVGSAESAGNASQELRTVQPSVYVK